MDKYDELIQKAIDQHKKYIDAREEYNLKILDYIKEKVNEYPMLRFCQLLELLGLTNSDKFYEESVETYNNLFDI